MKQSAETPNKMESKMGHSVKSLHIHHSKTLQPIHPLMSFFSLLLTISERYLVFSNLVLPLKTSVAINEEFLPQCPLQRLDRAVSLIIITIVFTISSCITTLSPA